MQRKLSQWATENPHEQYRELYHLLCNETWLRVAHHSVNTNEGRDTAGIDGETMSNFNGNLDGNLEALREKLKTRPLEPVSVRRCTYRSQGYKAHSWVAKDCQEALRMILEHMGSDFSERS
jgi:retron-type reverse transcriptase